MDHFQVCTTWAAHTYTCPHRMWGEVVAGITLSHVPPQHLPAPVSKGHNCLLMHHALSSATALVPTPDALPSAVTERLAQTSIQSSCMANQGKACAQGLVTSTPHTPQIA